MPRCVFVNCSEELTRYSCTMLEMEGVGAVEGELEDLVLGAYYDAADVISSMEEEEILLLRNDLGAGDRAALHDEEDPYEAAHFQLVETLVNNYVHYSDEPDRRPTGFNLSSLPLVGIIY